MTEPIKVHIAAGTLFAALKDDPKVLEVRQHIIDEFTATVVRQARDLALSDNTRRRIEGEIKAALLGSQPVRAMIAEHAKVAVAQEIERVLLTELRAQVPQMARDRLKDLEGLTKHDMVAQVSDRAYAVVLARLAQAITAPQP